MIGESTAKYKIDIKLTFIPSEQSERTIRKRDVLKGTNAQHYLHCTDITVGSNDERRSSAVDLLAFQTPTPLYQCGEKTSLLARDMGYMNFFKLLRSRREHEFVF